MFLKISSLLLFCLLIDFGSAGNYLFYLPLSSRSIKLGFMPMAKELAKRGHKVFMVSPHKEKKPIPNIEDLNHESGFDDIQKEFSKILLVENSGSVNDLPTAAIFQESLDTNRNALRMPKLQKILFDDGIKIDVVVGIPVFGNEVGAWIANKKNASFVHFFSVPFILPWIATSVGTPINPAYMPVPVFPFGQRMSFQERLKTTLATYFIMAARQFYILPKVAAVITSEFPDEDVTDFPAMTQEAALVINMGSPFTGDGLRPVMPNLIRGGLMSCKHENNLGLEGELKTWVEGAEHGVIYLSFGSVVRASEMPEEKRLLILSVLSKLKQRVVWKWEKEMTGLPANVKTFTWLPQLDILAHPNVKLFITHGGAGSIQETICYKTPIVGIPIMGDQMNNLAEAITQHIGIVLPYSQVRADNLLEAITTVLEDPSYLDSVTNLQNLILDTPLHPLDNTVWWLEYLLRHPHNPRMRSPAKDLYWFQYYLLDVAGFVLMVVYIVYKMLRTILSLICGFCCKSKTSKQKTQ